MITRLRGVLIEKEPTQILLEVGGVGYRVHIGGDTYTALPSEGSEAILWTHLAVREDSQDLYGFVDQTALSFFEQLIKISGIGPKSALGVMSVAPVSTLRDAIASGNTGYLTKVSGIGKKTAEKIVLELRDKLAAGDHGTVPSNEMDALEALRQLGYSTNEARDTLREVPPDIVETSARIKAALRILGSKK